MLECLNGGKCVKKATRYECECPEHLVGETCNETTEEFLSRHEKLYKINSYANQENKLLRNLISLVEKEEMTQSGQFNNSIF